MREPAMKITAEKCDNYLTADNSFCLQSVAARWWTDNGETI